MRGTTTRPIGRRGSRSTSASGPTVNVGIWHETYLVPAGSYECVYNNMPATGLGEATALVPAAGRKATAASRVGVREESHPEGAPTERIDV